MFFQLADKFTSTKTYFELHCLPARNWNIRTKITIMQKSGFWKKGTVLINWPSHPSHNGVTTVLKSQSNFYTSHFLLWSLKRIVNASWNHIQTYRLHTFSFIISHHIAFEFWFWLISCLNKYGKVCSNPTIIRWPKF